jgi:hypothetical protein
MKVVVEEIFFVYTVMKEEAIEDVQQTYSQCSKTGRKKEKIFKTIYNKSHDENKKMKLYFIFYYY